MLTQRYKLTIAYRGTRYHGWQKQLANQYYKGPKPSSLGMVGIPTIQEIVASTIQRVVRHPITLVGSSRTDSGVHAKGQVAHFDTTNTLIPVRGLVRGINHHLPDDIAIRSIELVPDTFCAIGSTICKRYQYYIWNTFDRPLFFPELVWHRYVQLDVDAMRAAAAYFVGTHDFASFAKAGHGRESTVRTVNACEVSYRDPRLVIGVEGNGFLWNMVRIMVGTLVEVGMKRFKPEDIRDILASNDRRTAGTTAPASGLYLQWIKSSMEPATPLPSTPIETMECES